MSRFAGYKYFEILLLRQKSVAEIVECFSSYEVLLKMTYRHSFKRNEVDLQAIEKKKSENPSPLENLAPSRKDLGLFIYGNKVQF